LKKALEVLLSTNIEKIVPISNGAFCQCYQLITQHQSYFLKTATTPKGKLIIESEFDGLNLLKRSEAIKLPKIISYSKSDYADFLVLEYFSFIPKNEIFWDRMGKQLALLHLETNEYWGNDNSNYIGDLSQSNPKRNSLADHLFLDRFAPQINLARGQGYISCDEQTQITSVIKNSISKIPSENASLIHGDLWSGNFANTADNIPITFDPSANFSHREFDLAMMCLFGQVPREFNESYFKVFPLTLGWKERIEFFQSYYLLVHLNMFGLSYKAQLFNLLKKYQ